MPQGDAMYWCGEGDGIPSSASHCSSSERECSLCWVCGDGEIRTGLVLYVVYV